MFEQRVFSNINLFVENYISFNSERDANKCIIINI